MCRLIARLLPTLHQRLIAIIALSMATCLTVLSLASNEALRSIEKNRLQSALVSELTYVSDAIERDYMELIQISEQMVPQGSIGRLMDEYFYAESAYQKYEILSLLPNVVVPITLGNYALLNLFYYAEDGTKIPFTYMQRDAAFDLATLPVLHKGTVVQYNAAHPSSSYGVSSEVLSIARPIEMGDQQLSIYVESRAPMKNLLSRYDANLPYAILQVNADNTILYSTDAAFVVGDRLTIEGEMENGALVGRTGGYYGAMLPSRVGFSTALLLPERVYHSELYQWRLRVCLIVSLSVLLLFAVSLSVRRLIYQPMDRLEKEMIRVGRGELDEVSYHSSVAEFDDLFVRFGEMKANLQQSILDRESVQAENHRLEMEKLLYQINPHFLMNTLNSAHWMAKIREQGEIAAFLTDLSYILGYSLGKTEPVTTLRTELRYVRAYLQLQKQRYDFGVTIDIEDKAYLDTPSARMILQPIAENAIQHGMDVNGTLRLCVFHDEKRDQAVAIIEDDGKSLSVEEFMDSEKPFSGGAKEGKKHTGIGLRYVRMMLAEYYGDGAQMAITRRPESGTRVTLFLPIQREGRETV